MNFHLKIIFLSIVEQSKFKFRCKLNTVVNHVDCLQSDVENKSFEQLKLIG